MKQFCFFVLLMLLIPSCKKGQADFKISGTITDQTFLQPLEGATVTITKKNADNGEEKYVTSLTSDHSGMYSFDVARDRFVSLNIRIEKDGYFTIDKTVFFSDLSVKNENLIHFDVTGKSWVRIILKHNGSATTKMDVVRTKGKSGCAECCPGGYQQFVGITDTTFYCVNDAGTDYEITYVQHESTVAGSKKVTTPFMDTVDLLLAY